MAEGEWVIQEIRMAGPDLVLRIPASPNLKPAGGQFFQVYAPGFDEPSATSLFFGGDYHQSWDLVGVIPAGWNPGTCLHWRGPLGRGFTLPENARKAAFVPWLDQGLSLLPLVHRALDKQAACVWYGYKVPDWLPLSVEVLPPDLLPEVFNWADYLAMKCNLIQLGKLAAALGLSAASQLNCKAEVLVHTPLVCAGIGECGVCSVKTKHGWKQACKDGPVFDLDLLELVL